MVASSDLSACTSADKRWPVGKWDNRPVLNPLSSTRMAEQVCQCCNSYEHTDCGA